LATGNYIVANGSYCCFPVGIKGCLFFVLQHGSLYAESFETASLDKETLNLPQNVSRFYALQVMSLTKEQQSQNLFLKVGPLPIIHNNKCTAQGKQLETSAKLRVFVSNISLLPLKRR